MFFMMIRVLFLSSILSICGFAAQAATRTIDIHINDLADYGGVFAALGIAPVSSATAQISFDDTAPIYRRSITGLSYDREMAGYGYSAFSLTLGDLTIEAIASNDQNGMIMVGDAIGGGTRPGQDFVQIDSRVPKNLGGGLRLTRMSLFSFADNEDVLDGTGVPDLDALNALDSFSVFQMFIYDRQSRRQFVLGSSTVHYGDLPEGPVDDIGPAPVPVPAGLPLILTGLAGLFALRGRQVRG